MGSRIIEGRLSRPATRSRCSETMKLRIFLLIMTVIVAAKEPCTSSIGCNLITVAEQYRTIHSSTDLLHAREIIRTKRPDYLDAFDEAICEGHSFSPCNMIICKKELMDRYCKWLFKIEKQLDKRIDYISGRDSYQQRMPALSQNDCSTFP